jgi:hypothetical protein
MIRRLLFLPLFVFFISPAFAIEIQLEPISVLPGNYNFYISEIIDMRTETGPIGFGYTGMFNSKETIELLPNTIAALENYLKAIPQDTINKTPIILGVKKLFAYEKTGAFSENAYIESHFSFFSRTDSNNLILLFEMPLTYKKGGMDVTKYHNYNIRYAVDKSLYDFNNSSWQNVLQSGDTVQITSVQQKGIATKISSSDTIPAKIIGTDKAISFSGGLGKNANMFGLYFSYIARKETGWKGMSNFGLQIINVDYQDGNEKYTGTIAEYFTSFGLLRKMSSSSSWGLLEFFIPLGSERINNEDGTTENRFYFGLGASQCIALIPVKKQGVFLITGPYERFHINSKAYPWDIGIKATIGCKW